MYLNIVKKTFESLLEKKYILMKALFIPFIILTIIEYLSTEEMKVSIGSYNFYILVGISLFISIVISITIHRIFLLEENETPSWGLYKFGSREVTFTLKAIGMILLLALTSAILFFISSFFGKIIESTLGSNIHTIYTFMSIGLILILVGLLFSRFSLVFPSIAIDKPIDLTVALELSRNYKLLLFVSVIIFPIVFGLIIGFVYGLAIGFLMGVISSKLSVLLSLLNLFITVFTIGFLSTAYEYIMSHQIKKTEVITEEVKIPSKPLKEVEFKELEDTFIVNIHDTHDTSFEKIKKELITQYESLGFKDNAIDRENKWMIKNPENETAYVYLSYISNEYKVESYNTEKPILKLLKV